MKEKSFFRLTLASDITTFIIAGVNILNYCLLKEDIRMDTFLQVLKYVGFALGYVLVVAMYFVKHYIDKKKAEAKYKEELDYAEIKKSAEEASEVSGCKDGATKLSYAFNICKNAIQAYKYFKLTDEEIVDGINKDIDLTTKVNVSAEQLAKANEPAKKSIQFIDKLITK